MPVVFKPSFGSAAASGTAGCAGRLVATLFFSVFLGMGLLFLVLIAQATWRSLGTWRWDRTPCTIQESAPEPGRDGSYHLRLRYAYSAKGREYTGTRLRLDPPNWSDAGDAERRARRYAAGSRTECFVDPASPGEAVLERSAPWFALFLLLPLVFVAVGAGGIYGVWKGGGSGFPPGAGVTKPLSRKGAGRAGWHRAGLVLFGGVFFVVGLVVTWFLLVRPVEKLLEARGWRETPCEVVSSRVQSHPGDDGTTYSVAIVYRYEVDGVEHTGNRYDFLGGSSSGYDGKAEVVDRYPAGRRTVCFVNPEDPTDSVLERGWRARYLLGLFPLLFVAAGLGIMVWGGGQRPPLPGTRPVAGAEEAAASPSVGPAELKTKASPLAKFLGAVAIAAFWNGIVSIFVWQVAQGFQRGRPEWFPTLFLAPFVLVGLFFVGLVGYQFLALFNPRLHLTLDGRAVRLGESLELEWRFSGSASRIARLTVALEGREEATYTRGTRTSTDKRVFLKIPVAECFAAPEIVQGRRRVTLPAGTMHSFASAHNKVVWALKVHGDIPRWPDVDEEFEVTVLPLRPEVCP